MNAIMTGVRADATLERETDWIAADSNELVAL